MDRFHIKISATYKSEIEYICDVVLGQFLGLPYFIEWLDKPANSYAIGYEGNECLFPDVLFQIKPEHWLKKISHPKLPLTYVSTPAGHFSEKVPVLYGCETPKTIDDIDILGSIFFMITRYEEVDEDTVDIFGRYKHQNSVLYKEKILRRALANEYVELLKHRIKTAVPRIAFRKHSYKVSISHDVDVPITYNMSWTDTVKKSLGDVRFRRSPGLAFKRYYGRLAQVVTGSYLNDPNNNFGFIMDAEEKAGLSSLFNFLPIPGNGPYDSNYNLDSPVIHEILKKISKRGFEIGFHPGFNTFKDLSQTKKQLDWLNLNLEKLSIAPVSKGRQHYLRWSNPLTWRIWDQLGLKEDSSVGYGMINGFRAGCCYKYKVFDLLERRALELIEEPLIVMDVNSDVNANDPAILSEVTHFHHVCKFFNGNFTLLYHNNYIISPLQKRTFARILQLVA
jgi:hypothetical protein